MRQTRPLQTAQKHGTAASTRQPTRAHGGGTVLRLPDAQLAHAVGIGDATEEAPPDRRLMIFDAMARAADDQLRQFRVMSDTGSTGEFMSPQAAKRGGYTLTTGEFGWAQEAFGTRTPLTQQAQGVTISLTGEFAGSGLAAVHTTTHTFTIAPLSGYDILLGTGFLDQHRADLHVYDRAMTLLDAEGRGIRVQGHRRAAEAAADAESTQAVRTETPGWKELTQHEPQRASAVNFTRAAQNLREQVARHAAERLPQVVITAKQFEAERRSGLWDGARIFCIHGGERHERDTKELPSAGAEYAAPGDGAAPPDDVVCSVTVADGRLRTEARAADERVESRPGRTKGARSSTTQTGDQRAREAEMCAALTAGEAADGDFAGLLGDERRRASTTLAQLLSRYADVFPDKLPAGLPPTRGVPPFKIELKPGAEPRGSYGARMTVNRQWDKLHEGLPSTGGSGCASIRVTRPWRLSRRQQGAGNVTERRRNRSLWNRLAGTRGERGLEGTAAPCVVRWVTPGTQRAGGSLHASGMKTCQSCTRLSEERVRSDRRTPRQGNLPKEPRQTGSPAVT